MRKQCKQWQTLFSWAPKSLQVVTAAMKLEDACSLNFPSGSEVKASACNAGDLGLIPGSGRSPGEGNGNPLQYSCLENTMDGGAWWAAVYGVAQSRTQLKWLNSNSSNRLIIAFLPKEQVSFNFMAAVTTCSDFGAPPNKVCHCFHCFPIYLPWSDGTKCPDISILNIEF